MHRLSPRLLAIIELIRPADVLWDIGCDHGFVCIEAISREKAVKAVAADTAPGPLANAERNIRDSGLSGRISCVLSDGFKELGAFDLPDCIVMAGMGGHLVIDILRGAADAGIDLKKTGQIIIGAQSDLELVRSFILYELCMNIECEICVTDEGKYYIIFNIIPGNENLTGYSEADLFLGHSPVSYTENAYRDYIDSTAKRLGTALKNAAVFLPDDDERLMGLKRKLMLAEKRKEELLYD